MTLTIDIEQFEHEEIDIHELKAKLKDHIPPALENSMRKHNEIMRKINDFEEDLTVLTPFQLSHLKQYYGRAEYEAWKLAGYFKAQYQFYNGRAATERGKFYIYERDKNGYNVNDSNYRSKIHEGINQEIAGLYEGYFVTWRGIANTHEGMQTNFRDMMNAIAKET